MDWEPIETIDAENAAFCLVFGAQGDSPPFIATASRVGDEWICEPPPADDYWAVRIVPTHWMPLPEPPQ